MGIAGFAVRRRVAVAMLSLAIVVLGFFAVLHERLAATELGSLLRAGEALAPEAAIALALEEP